MLVLSGFQANILTTMAKGPFSPVVIKGSTGSDDQDRKNKLAKNALDMIDLQEYGLVQDVTQKFKDKLDPMIKDGRSYSAYMLTTAGAMMFIGSEDRPVN